jgi:hypothetical protein
MNTARSGLARFVRDNSLLLLAGTGGRECDPRAWHPDLLVAGRRQSASDRSEEQRVI